MARSRLCLVAASLALAACPSLATAQSRIQQNNGPGFDTHLFRPTIDSKGFFTVNGVNTLGSGDLSFGFVSDYGGPLLRLKSGHGESALIDHSLQGTLNANVGLLNRLVIGVSAPVILASGGKVDNVGKTGEEYTAGNLDAQHLAHVAGHIKARITKNTEAIGVAVIVQGGAPVSPDAAKNLSGEPKPWYWPQLALEKAFGDEDVRIGVNAGYRGNTSSGSTRFDQLSAGKFTSTQGLITGGVAASVRLLGKLELVAESYATKQAGGSSASKVSLSQEVVGGAKIFVEKRSYLLIGGGTRIGDGYEAASRRGFIGFMFEPSIGDRDGDGIADDLDGCPDEPEDFDDFEDSDGCPDPDNDQDGIPDKRDACRNIPETKNGFQDEDGCPDQEIIDSDKDGIPDVEDQCPNAGGPNIIREKGPDYGCPDRDGDGIPDKRDKCPDDPEDKDDFEDSDGCPDPDNDRDGIPDLKDHCPLVPETKNGFQDEDGCPDEAPPKGIVIEGNSILILEKIQFETGSAKIRKESTPILDAVAQTLKAHPEFEIVEIQGHADERGAAQTNVRLTDARAKAVVEAIVSRGIDKGRVRSIGYGSFCPVDPEHTAKAWEKNRRVEFKIVKASGQATGVELGCEEARKAGIK